MAKFPDRKSYALHQRGEVLKRCLKFRAYIAEGGRMTKHGEFVTAEQLRWILKNDQQLLLQYRRMIQANKRLQ